MNELIDNIIFSVMTGIVASLFSVLLLYSFKPKLEISTKIAKQKDTRGEIFFGVKVVNKSRSAVKNIIVSWEILIPKTVPNGIRYECIQLHLRKDVKYIHGKNRNKSNVYIFNTVDNIEDLWSDTTNMSIVFRIYCEHAIFSTGKQFIQKYMYKRTDIVEGIFEAEDSMNII